MFPPKPRLPPQRFTGELTDPRLLGEEPHVTMPAAFKIDDSAVIPPATPGRGYRTYEVLRGPNIKPFPKIGALQTDTLSAELLLKVGDNITTDHIMPAGAEEHTALPLKYSAPFAVLLCCVRRDLPRARKGTR